MVVNGAQWGDEGKGKIVDLFTENADLVVRFQGGNNAGHTLVVDSGDGPRKTVLHLIPSGILYPEKANLIASGVVVDVGVLFEELDGLAAAGREVSSAQLRVSRDAHVTMPYHRAIDHAREARRADDAIGTTGRGIGPAYEDRAARRGVRTRDLEDAHRLRRALEHVLPEKNAVLNWYGAETFDLGSLVEYGLDLGRRLAPHLCDCRSVIHGALSDGRRVLFEGAQGTLLDIGHGTYPFVTSSYTTTGGVCVGAGIPPAAIGAAIGVAKAYSTRVGAGPFPTELEDDTGAFLRKHGAEFGATTGRPRRCGWFDAAAMRASQRLNGFTGLAVTKLDVMTGLTAIQVCTAYDTPAGRVETADLDAQALSGATPVYETLPGWTEDIRAARSLEDLPTNARAYLRRIEELVGVPLAVVSVGPGRNETIQLAQPFG